MRFRIKAAVAALALVWTAPAVGQTPDFVDRWRAFDAAQAADETAAAADIASELAAADFAASDLSVLESVDARSQMALALAVDGRAEQAQAIWGIIHAFLRANITIAEQDGAAARASDLKGLLVRHLRDAADAARGSGNPALAAVLLDEAWALTVETLGDEEPAARFVLEEKIAAEAEAGQEPNPAQVSLLARLAERARQQSLTSLGTEPPEDSLPQTETFETIRVFYGSTRAGVDGTEDPHRAYRKRGRDDLSFGSVVVTVPRDRAQGTIPRPGTFSYGGAKDGVHIVLKRLERDGDANAWAARLRRSLDVSDQPTREAFIYVHGHATAFDDAALRTAQLAADLDIRQGAIFYAWPAAGGVLSYRLSELGADGAEFGLVDLIKTAAPEADTVHLIAHSMGNRVLLRALEFLEAEGYALEGREGAPFGEVVWASPDVDADTFARRVPAVSDLARGMTLYASESDRALGLSQWLYSGFQRAGVAPVLPRIAAAVTSVDTSAFALLDFDFVNHGDFASDSINDLRAVLWFSLAPEARCPLILNPVEVGVGFWRADPSRQGCGDTEFRRALQAKRLYGDDAAARVQDLVPVLEAEGDVENAASWRGALAILEAL